MIFTYEYDRSHIPAMPVVEVDIRRLAQDKGIMLVAIVDSGSDATMIPLRYLRQLKARKAEQVRVRDVSGLSYDVDTYRISLHVGSLQIGRLMVLADRQNQQMILGRDVLNQLIVTLNGLAHVVELSS